jgi:hypothetical protein
LPAKAGLTFEEVMVSPDDADARRERLDMDV